MMLRLRIEECLPWVDSSGRIRSPYESFQLLREDARDCLEAGEVRELRAWKFGVVATGGQRPLSSKPQVLGGETQDGPAAIGYAVGVEKAAVIADRLVPLWTEFFDLLIGTSMERVFFADQKWHPEEGKWLSFGPAVEKGLIPIPAVDLVPAGRAGMFTATMDFQKLAELLRSWWPSGLGLLAGVLLGGSDKKMVDRRIARQGQLSCEDLSSVVHYFETSRSFDNLGFSVLTRGKPWDDLQGYLASKGWSDGIPVNAVLPTSL